MFVKGEKIKRYLKLIPIGLFTKSAKPPKLQEMNPMFDAQIILYLYFFYFINVQLFILKIAEPLPSETSHKML